MIGLAPDHPAISAGITAVEFSKACLNNEALGKRKRGALGMRPKTLICTVTCADGSIHSIEALVNADLVEINHRLETQPGILQSDPEGAGFLCVALTRAEKDMSRCFPEFVHRPGQEFISVVVDED